MCATVAHVAEKKTYLGWTGVSFSCYKPKSAATKGADVRGGVQLDPGCRFTELAGRISTSKANLKPSTFI